MVNSVKISTVITSLIFVAAASSAVANDFPEGKGKEAVQAICSACHNVNRISTGLGYSREHWLALMDSMIDLSGD